jgi:hypothetical protein
MTAVRQSFTRRMVRKGYVRLRYAPADITCCVFTKPFSNRRMRSGLLSLLLVVAQAGVQLALTLDRIFR